MFRSHVFRRTLLAWNFSSIMHRWNGVSCRSGRPSLSYISDEERSRWGCGKEGVLSRYRCTKTCFRYAINKLNETRTARVVSGIGFVVTSVPRYNFHRIRPGLCARGFNPRIVIGRNSTHIIINTHFFFFF